MSLHHCNWLVCLTLLCTSFYYFHLLFYLMLSSPLFYALLYFLIPPTCLLISFSFPKCPSQHSFSCFLHFCFVPFTRKPIFISQNPGHLLSKCFLTACLLHFPPSYLWLYFFCFFSFLP